MEPFQGSAGGPIPPWRTSFITFSFSSFRFLHFYFLLCFILFSYYFALSSPDLRRDVILRCANVVDVVVIGTDSNIGCACETKAQNQVLTMLRSLCIIEAYDVHVSDNYNHNRLSMAISCKSRKSLWVPVSRSYICVSLSFASDVQWSIWPLAQ